MCFVLLSCNKGKAKDKPKNSTNSNSTTETISKDTTTSTTNNTNSNDKLEALISNMTIEEKVGQMFLARCPEENAKSKSEQYHLGGYVLFAENTKNDTKSSLKKKISSYQNDKDIPLFISVDEEGGLVNRISKYKQYRAYPFLSPQELYNMGGYKLIISDTKEKADLLLSLGFNINMAPVCDVSFNSKDYIFKRTFGKNAKETSKYVTTVVETMKDKDIGCVLKHFPGYGNNIDTHKEIGIDNRPLNQFENSDLIPFQVGFDIGADSVLVSHNIVKCFDSNSPASLSKPVHDYIRKYMHYNGVIMTDDLYMDGIRKFVGEESASVMAVKAGNDIVCCTNFEVQIPPVIKAVKNGDIDINQINDSVLRILRWKQNIGLI